MSPAASTIIVEDEPLARRALRTLIADTAWLDLLGEADNGEQGLELIRVARPELIFLDIQLPGMHGVDVLAQAGRDTVVILTTAFDEHALVAFELGAIDYIRKPFGRERFDRALMRAAPQITALRARARRSTGSDAEIPLEARLAQVREHSRPLDVIYARDRGSIVPIPIVEVHRLEADGDFVAVFWRERRYLVCVTLRELSSRLDPTRFVRVHRSHVVNLSAVAEMASIDANRVEVRMRDGSKVVASRTGTRLLRERARWRA